MTFDSDTAHWFTQWLMAGGFVSAASCCAQSRRPVLAIFFALATVETFVRARYPFHVAVREALVGGTSGIDKERLQLVLIGAMAVAALVAGALVARTFLRRSWPEGLVQLGVWGVLGILGLELVSPHAVDKFIYQIDGPFLRCGWFYCLAALIVAAGAIGGRKQANAG